MAYLKPQSPIRYGEDHIYPLTTVDQIMMDDGNRLSGVGVYLEKPEESTDTTVYGNNATTFNGYTFDAFRALMLDTIYPMGSIYMSVSATSPETLFGGTWTPINGRFLIGTGAPENNDDGASSGNYNYAAGSKGGEAAHTLTNSEMPKHVHNTTFQWNATHDSRYTGSANAIKGEGTSNNCYAWVDNGYLLDIGINKSAGNNVAHNNMPPYLAVYMWQRTA